MNYEQYESEYNDIFNKELRAAELYNLNILNCTSPFSEHYGCHNCTRYTCSVLNQHFTELEIINKKIIKFVKLINIDANKSFKIIMNELTKINKSKKLNTIPYNNIIGIENYNHSLSFIENINNYTKHITIQNLKALLFDICIFLDLFYNFDEYNSRIKNKYDIINSEIYKYVFDKLIMHYV